MADNNFSAVVESLLKGLDGFATAKTVVGDAVQIKDTIILPLVDITFGIGAGAALNEEKKKNSGGGGMAAKMSPSAVLVIQNGMTRLVNVKNQDTVTKILDMAPDLIDRFKKKEGSVVLDPEMEQAVEDAVKEEL